MDNGPVPPSGFAGRARLYRQRVNLFPQQVGERGIDHALARDTALSGELPGHDLHREMTFA